MQVRPASPKPGVECGLAALPHACSHHPAAERCSRLAKSTEAVTSRRLPNTALGSDGQGPKGFSFVFLELFDFLIFLLTWRELAWVSWSVRRGRARSCEYVWIAQSDSGLIRRETSRAPGDLTWQRTLAVVVCAALSRGRL